MLFIFKVARLRQPRLPGTRFIGGRPARRIGPAKKPADAAGGSYNQRWGHLFAAPTAGPAAKKAGLRRALVGGTGLLTSASRAASGRLKGEARKAERMTNRKPLAGG